MLKSDKALKTTAQSSQAAAHHSGVLAISKPAVKPVIQGAFWYRQYVGGPTLYYSGAEPPLHSWDFEQEIGKSVYYPFGRISVEEYLAQKKEAKRKKNIANSTMPLLTMTEIFFNAVEHVDIPKRIKNNVKMLNIFLDIGYAELKAMNLEAKMNFPTYMKNALAYTSCHNTAQKLLARMSDPTEETSSFLGKDKEEAAEAHPSSNWMQAVALSLQSAIATDIDEGNRSIYEIHCGGHGFAILVRNGNAEILQSFANAISLVQRMKDGSLLLNRATVTKLITDLASGTESDRNNAAFLIANCNAELFGLNPACCFQYRWRKAGLLGDDALLDFFKTELKNSYDQVKGAGLLKRL